MNVLLDFITVIWRTGAGEYHRRVISKLMEQLRVENRNNVYLYALYDSELGIAYEELQEHTLNQLFPIKFVDIRKNNLISIIKENRIERFFIACGQYLGQYPEIEHLSCEVICVIHDLSHEEMSRNRLDSYLKLTSPKYKQGIKAGVLLAKYFFMSCIQYKNDNHSMYNLKYLIRMLELNPNALCVVVSEYTKSSLLYNFRNIKREQVKVLYTPLREKSQKLPIENEQLLNLIEQNVKYYFAVSCNRRSKNPYKLINAFEKYAEEDESAHLVLVSYSGNLNHPRIHNLSFLTDSDLAWAMQHCYALVYPSYFEGFGLPPLEAMRYGKPILASNATSIPEVLSDAPIYFCPFYESAIYEAFCKLKDNIYNDYAFKSHNRIKLLEEKQERDLDTLVEMIIGK